MRTVHVPPQSSQSIAGLFSFVVLTQFLPPTSKKQQLFRSSQHYSFARQRCFCKYQVPDAGSATCWVKGMIVDSKYFRLHRSYGLCSISYILCFLGFFLQLFKNLNPFLAQGHKASFGGWVCPAGSSLLTLVFGAEVWLGLRRLGQEASKGQK